MLFIQYELILDSITMYTHQIPIQFLEMYKGDLSKS